MVVSKDPGSIIKKLEEKYKLKLKGTGPIGFHLGSDFFHDRNGILCMTSKSYVTKLLANYFRTFNEMPKNNVWSPMEKGDHPELDTSEELDLGETKKFQSLLGALQWLVTIGRLDIATAVMTLSKFRIAPRAGHMKRVQRIFSYLSCFKDGTIRFRTSLPDYSALDNTEYDWERTVYGQVSEHIPYDLIEPLGNPIVMS